MEELRTHRARREVLVDALRSLRAGLEEARTVCSETAGHHTWSRRCNNLPLCVQSNRDKPTED
jgi:hypothetical protein